MKLKTQSFLRNVIVSQFYLIQEEVNLVQFLLFRNLLDFEIVLSC